MVGPRRIVRAVRESREQAREARTNASQPQRVSGEVTQDQLTHEDRPRRLPLSGRDTLRRAERADAEEERNGAAPSVMRGDEYADPSRWEFR